MVFLVLARPLHGPFTIFIDFSSGVSSVEAALKSIWERKRERERACSYSSLRVLTPSRARTAMVRSQILCWLKNVVKGCVIKTATNATFDHIYLVSIVHISTVAVGFQNMYTELCKGMYVFKFYGIMRPCSRTACQKTANQLLAEDNGPILATLGPSRSRPCSS